VKPVEIVGNDRSGASQLLTAERKVSVDKGPVETGEMMSQQSVRQAARRSALDAQAALRKERADRRGAHCRAGSDTTSYSVARQSASAY
jgi:hypothetical protein